MEGSTYFDPRWLQSGWTDAVNLNFFRENTSIDSLTASLPHKNWMRFSFHTSLAVRLPELMFSKCEKFEHSSLKLVLKLTDGHLISGSIWWSLLCFICRYESCRAVLVSQRNTRGLIPYTSNQKQISWVNIQSMRLIKYNLLLLLYTHLSFYIFSSVTNFCVCQWLSAGDEYYFLFF